MDVSGKQVLITGAAQGLGKSIAIQLNALGAKVTALDINESALEDLNSTYPDMNVISCDLTNIDSVNQQLNILHSAQGAFDILINNAGLIHNEPLINLLSKTEKKHSIENWNKVLDVNLNSVFYVTRICTEAMLLNRKKSVIINISSISSSGNPGQGAYSAAKAGIEALTRTWAKELGPMGIRIAAVAPGFIETDATHASMSEGILKQWINNIPLKHLGTMKNVSDAVLHIIENNYITGTVLEINGGLVL